MLQLEPEEILQLLYHVLRSHEILVLIASASSESSGKPAHQFTLTRVFSARIHQVFMKMMTLTQMLTSNLPGIVSIGVYTGENPGFLERGFIFIKLWEGGDSLC